ncbi:MAG: phosphopantetheine-binding protein [Dysgonamonadaceae bacterium]|jgi:acyl carrier protein|nr:phosphopantetheine-binding protein [Dysgonamonadaceae bacterium]
MNKDALVEQLKVQIIAALSLEDITPEDIDPAAPLFVEGLGLDSIDALELILLLDKQYGIKIEDPRERRNALQSINAMADCILNISPKNHP